MTYPVNPTPIFKWGNENGPEQAMKAFKFATVLGPMVHYADVTSQIDAGGVTPLTGGPTRGLFVDQKGTLTGHDAFGNAISGIILQAGYNPICIGGITSVTSITQIIAVY